MKKLLKILGIAVAFTAILGFGFVGCSDDSYIPQQEEAKTASKPVNASWSFPKAPKGIDTSNTNLEKATVIGADALDAIGGTLSAVGKLKYVAAVEGTNDSYLEASKTSNTLSSYTKVGLKDDGSVNGGAVFTFTLDDTAKVTLEAACLAGSYSTGTWFIAIYKGASVVSEEEPILAVNETSGLPGSATENKVEFAGDAYKWEKELEGGTYRIYANAVRIFSFSVKNDVKAKNAKKNIAWKATDYKTLTNIATDNSTSLANADCGATLAVTKAAGASEVSLKYNSSKEAFELAPGTVLKVPVTTKGDVVTITTVGGGDFAFGKYETVDTEYTVTADDVKAGYMKIEALNTLYIAKIIIGYTNLPLIVDNGSCTTSLLTPGTAVPSEILTLPGEADNVKSADKWSNVGKKDGNNVSPYVLNETNKTVTIAAYPAYSSTSKQKWISAVSGGSTSKSTWENADDPAFIGSANYGLDKVATCATSRAYFFAVTNCTAVKVLGDSGSETRKVVLNVYEITPGADENHCASYKGTNTDSKIESTTTAIDKIEGLDKDKKYLIEVTGDNKDNSCFYEISFTYN